jgi:hypothetical protein
LAFARPWITASGEKDPRAARAAVSRWIMWEGAASSAMAFSLPREDDPMLVGSQINRSYVTIALK